MGCPLCERWVVTTVHFEDHNVWITDCASCGVPMAVLKRHTADPLDSEREMVRNLLAGLFPGRTFDERMRTIPGHYHAHAR